MYQPPPMMQFSPVKFGGAGGGQMGALAGLLKQLQPNQTQANQQQYPGGMLGAMTSAVQGNPQGGLAKQLFGGGTNPAQMGLLSGLMQKLQGGGMTNPTPMAGPAPTALTGLW